MPSLASASERLRGGGVAVPQLEPGHRLPATAAPAPSRRQVSHKLKPPTSFRVTISSAQHRHLSPALVGDLHKDDAIPGRDRDRDHSARSTGAAVPDAIAGRARSPARRLHLCTGAPNRALRSEFPRDPRPFGPPGNRYALLNRSLSHRYLRLFLTTAGPRNSGNPETRPGNARST